MAGHDISAAAEGDVPALLAFEKAMAVELGCPADDPRGSYDADWFGACCRGAFVRDNGHSLPCRTLVAREVADGGRVVGGIMCYLDRARFAASTGEGAKHRKAGMWPFVELFWVYVDPSARKAHVGTALLAAALADASGAWPETEVVRLHCLQTNAPGFAFWSRMGFAVVRAVKDYPLEGMSAWRMERPLLRPTAAAPATAPLSARAPSSSSAALPAALVVCGVMGSGKSRIGAELAAALGRPFVDADAFHPESNLVKMKAGVPLDDADREPWLRLLHADLDARVRARGPGVVLACSALRRVYRQALRGGLGDAVGFAQLVAGFELIEARATARSGHFMPPGLLRSQLDTQEPLDAKAEQPCVVVELGESKSPAEIVAEIVARWPTARMPEETAARTRARS
jgi:carbohydrate kinase (thermoresistant glucokinase family)